MIGYQTGEVCNRDGCQGIIEEYDLDSFGLSGCSCHINPPCSACTLNRNYCPECDWNAQEEADTELAKRDKVIPWESPKHKSIEEKISELDATKINWFISKSWHSGMEATGVYPNGTTTDDIKKCLGIQDKYSMARFERFGSGIFVVSYFTD